MGKYDDIINLPHHVSDYYKPMSMENRAAQFAPFAALTGHSEAIAETQRVTEQIKELSDYEKSELSSKLRLILQKNLQVKIVYFFPDKNKEGGCYKSITGFIKKYDEYDSTLIMSNDSVIPVLHISDVTILNNPKTP